MKTLAERQELYTRGIKLLENRKFFEARECFQKLANDYPDSCLAQYYFGVARLLTGMAEEAMANLSYAEDLLPFCGFTEEKKAELREDIVSARELCYYSLQNYEKLAELKAKKEDKKINSA